MSVKLHDNESARMRAAGKLNLEASTRLEVKFQQQAALNRDGVSDDIRLFNEKLRE